jgi:hypothetical protein
MRLWHGSGRWLRRGDALPEVRDSDRCRRATVGGCRFALMGIAVALAKRGLRGFSISVTTVGGGVGQR